MAPLIPGLNDPEIPAILEAAANRGGQWANYIIVRLPGGVKTMFRDWLECHVPDRANRILNRKRQMRSGHLSDPRFRSRMRGEGDFALLIEQFFAISRRKAGFPDSSHSLSTDHFRRGGHHQLQLNL